MNSSRLGTGRWQWALVAAVSAMLTMSGFCQASGSKGNWRDVNLDDYRKHLEGLYGLLVSCQKQRDAKGCDPALVGPDDRVKILVGANAIQREVRYGWMRALLDRAGKKQDASEENSAQVLGVKVQTVGVETLLMQARQRLNEDWRQAAVPLETSARYDAERRALTAILARQEYRGVTESSPRERFLEWLSNWLDHAFATLARFGSRSPWIAIAMRELLLGVLCLALVLVLIRIERQSRIRLQPEPLSVPGAPSAREWQLWLADARTMAAQDLWREAIHFLYWAAIARLESRRLWAADRARTPREYLELLPAADPRKGNLTTLTRSFERTWYGGRDAGVEDYRAALKQAAELGVE